MALSRVLVAEDDPGMIDFYRKFFSEMHAGEFRAHYCTDGEQALRLLSDEPLDVAILDWMLPRISGLDLAKALREHPKTRALAVLLVTAKSSAEDVARALETGADDYLPKPFDEKVLLARLHSLLRRRDLTREEHAVYELAGLRLDPQTRRLHVDGDEVRLAPKEFGLLKLFLEEPDRVHRHIRLWEAVWGYDSDDWERILTVTLSSLRRKLGPRLGARLETHRNAGYLFKRNL